MEADKIQIAGFSYEQDKKGNWSHKWDSKILKLDGTLKQPYKELPQYKTVIECEKKFIDSHNKVIADSVREMFQVLNTFGK